jgi:Phosphotransferase enzyme family
MFVHAESSVNITDPGISTLAEVFDTVELAKHLRHAFPGRWGAILNTRIRVLKHHPASRCTLEIGLCTDVGWSFLVGKVYATDRSDVYLTMDKLRRAGFGPEQECSIPEPLAYISPLRLLLLERIEGPRAKQIFLSDDKRNLTRASVRCARWLARFHAIAPRSGSIFIPAQQMDSVERWSERIAKLGEPFACQARQLSRSLAQAAPAVNGKQRCAGHGSYSCNQIILNKGRTITFDWDSADVADPCRDVARFVVALQRLGLKYLGSIRALDAPADVFLKTYNALSPFEVEPNLRFYRALTCLRLAKYEANRPVCTLREETRELLGEGLRALE